MDLRLRAYYCPCCGASLKPVAGQTTHCDYCEAVLEIEPEKVRGQRPPQAGHRPEAPLAEPPASLAQRSGPSFEMSLMSQLPPGASEDSEALTAVELSLDRFALVYLRVTDQDARTVAWGLPAAVIVESLECYGDPGLAANRALF